jgi:hypothetical protein
MQAVHRARTATASRRAAKASGHDLGAEQGGELADGAAELGLADDAAGQVLAVVEGQAGQLRGEPGVGGRDDRRAHVDRHVLVEVGRGLVLDGLPVEVGRGGRADALAGHQAGHGLDGGEAGGERGVREALLGEHGVEVGLGQAAADEVLAVGRLRRSSRARRASAGPGRPRRGTAGAGRRAACCGGRTPRGAPARAGSARPVRACGAVGRGPRRGSGRRRRELGGVLDRGRAGGVGAEVDGGGADVGVAGAGRADAEDRARVVEAEGGAVEGEERGRRGWPTTVTSTGVKVASARARVYWPSMRPSSLSAVGSETARRAAMAASAWARGGQVVDLAVELEQEAGGHAVVLDRGAALGEHADGAGVGGVGEEAAALGVGEGAA